MDFLLSWKGMLPPADAVRGLHDHRAIEPQRVAVTHLPLVDEGRRIGDAVVTAGRIEPVFTDQIEELWARDDRGNNVLAKFISILADELHVGVAAAKEDELFRRPRGGEPVHHIEECRVRFNGFACNEIHDATCVTRTTRMFAHDGGLHPVSLVKRPRHAVSIDVAPEDHGNEIAVFEIHLIV